MIIRYEHHRCPWGPEVYAIVDDLYDGGDDYPVAGVGSTEAEALADIKIRLHDMLIGLGKTDASNGTLTLELRTLLGLEDV